MCLNKNLIPLWSRWKMFVFKLCDLTGSSCILNTSLGLATVHGLRMDLTPRAWPQLFASGWVPQSPLVGPFSLELLMEGRAGNVSLEVISSPWKSLVCCRKQNAFAERNRSKRWGGNEHFLRFSYPLTYPWLPGRPSNPTCLGKTDFCL